MKPRRFVLFAVLWTASALAFLNHARADDASVPPPSPPKTDTSQDKPLPAAFLKAHPENLDDLKVIEKRVKEVLEIVVPCTVCILAGNGSGSGVIVTEDGYVLTAGHISGEPGRDVSIVMPDGTTHHGKTLGGNGTIDSGLVKITESGKWPFVEMGSSSAMKKNDWCLLTGHPGGFKQGRSPVVRVGRILEINDWDAAKYIRTDCTIVSGDSGGPLFDMHARVIGIHSRIGPGITANLHVPVDTFRDTWARLVLGERWGGGIGRPVRPTQGEADFRFKLDPSAKDCMVNEIVVESPAYRAGLKPGDVIKKFQGKEPTSVAALLEEFKKKKPGDEVRLEVRRGDESVKVTFVLGSKDEF